MHRVAACLSTMIRVRALLCILASACFAAHSAHADGNAGGSHLFILSGQSNMARLDPDISFVPAVEAAFGKDRVIVVKSAQAGQPIRRWYKKWDDRGEPVKTPAGDLYDLLISRVSAAIAGRKIQTVTFLWMQGESDAAKGWGDRYEDGLNGVIAQLEHDLARRDIHLVLGRLSDHRAKTGAPDWLKIRDIQMRVAQTRPFSAWINTDDLNDITDTQTGKTKDDLHYTPEGYRIFGRRLAETAISLIK